MTIGNDDDNASQWLFYPEHDTEIEYQHWFSKITESSIERIGKELVRSILFNTFMRMDPGLFQVTKFIFEINSIECERQD